MPSGSKRKIYLTAAAAVILFLAIQAVPVDRTNPPVTADVPAPAAVKEILHRSCYDCHSNETRWPWYSRVAPVSWWLAHHVHEARGDLDFSEWPLLDAEAQGQIMQDIEKQLVKGSMPLKSYLLGHPGARLSDEDRTVLLDWARSGS